MVEFSLCLHRLVYIIKAGVFLKSSISKQNPDKGLWGLRLYGGIWDRGASVLSGGSNKINPPVESRHWLWWWRLITEMMRHILHDNSRKIPIQWRDERRNKLQGSASIATELSERLHITLLKCCTRRWCINAAATDGRDARIVKIWRFRLVYGVALFWYHEKWLKPERWCWIAAHFLTSTLRTPAWLITAWSAAAKLSSQIRTKAGLLKSDLFFKGNTGTGVREKIKKWEGESRVMLAAAAAVQWTTLSGL